MEEEPHRSPVSSFTVHTTKPSSPVTHQDSLVQNADKEDIIQDFGQSKSEEVVVSVHVSPTVDFPAAEEEEEEEEQEQQQQEEEEEEEQEQQHQEEEEEQEEEEDAQSEGLTFTYH